MLDSGKTGMVRRLVQILMWVLALRPAFQRRTNKKKWSGGIDLPTLSGEEWLRLVVETNMDVLAGWCPRCRAGECDREKCQRCGAALVKFDEPFWCQIGRKIRRAMHKDRALLSRVKSDRESLYGTQHKPTFPTQLKWLFNSWEQAPRPPHQSFNPKVHYLVANRIASLQKLGLSKEEIIEVLSTADFPDGPVERQGKNFAGISGEDLRKLGEDFRRAVGYVPGSVLDLSEMWRTMTWVNRQRTVPMARLRGERVRRRSSAKD